MTAYAELQVTTNYSFLRGAAHPDELVAQAAGVARGRLRLDCAHAADSQAMGR